MKPKNITVEGLNSSSFLKRIRVNQQTDVCQKIDKVAELKEFKSKNLTIIFHDDEGLKSINTSIWAAGMKFVCLSGGIWLPIDRIVSINF